ncbi:hypothetical protein WJX79_009503 [Trebouxia sp. C0005]
MQKKQTAGQAKLGLPAVMSSRCASWQAVWFAYISPCCLQANSHTRTRQWDSIAETPALVHRPGQVLSASGARLVIPLDKHIWHYEDGCSHLQPSSDWTLKY